MTTFKEERERLKDGVDSIDDEIERSAREAGVIAVVTLRITRVVSSAIAFVLRKIR